MRIIYLLLIVCLGLATAKYLPNDSASTQLRRHLRSIEDDSSATNEDKSDNDDNSGEDTSEEGTVQEQPQIIEKEQQEILLKQEAKQLKQQQKIEKEERKKQEKIEKEERKRHEQLAKEEMKHQERMEKEKRKQEEAVRKQQEKIEKEERKRLVKLQKNLESNQISSDSSESSESNESNESLELDDIWRNHIYAKYGLTVNSTDLERKTALNRYSEEELGLNVNSTKSERRLAVIKLIQDNLNKDVASQDALRNFIIRQINTAAIQQLQVKLENEIAKLNNDSLLLENGTMPWVPEAKQTIDEKRTLIQSVLQFLSHLLPNWATGGQTPSYINSSTHADSQGTSESSGSAVTAASNVNEDLPSLSGAASSGAPEPAQGSAADSVDVNSGNNEVAVTGIDTSNAGSSNTASNSVPTLPSASPSDASQSGSIPSSEAVPATGPIEVAASDVETPATSSIDASAHGESTSGNSAAVTGSNSDTQESSVPSDEVVLATGHIDAATSDVETPAISSIDGSANGVSSSDDTAAVTGPNNNTQESSIPTGEVVPATGPIEVASTDVETPVTSSIDGSLNVDIAVVNGPNSSTQESSVLPGEAVPATGPVNVAASDVEAPASSSIDSSSIGVSTSAADDNAAEITPIETESPTPQESTIGVNEFTITGAGTSKPVHVSSSGTIAPENPAIGSVDDSSIGANLPVSESVNVVAIVEPAVGSTDAVSTSLTDNVSGSGDGSSIIVQEPVTGTTESSAASPISTSATVNIDVASAVVEQTTTDPVDTSQINSEPNVIESSVNSIDANSTVEPEAGPIDIASAAEVTVADVTNVVTTIDTSSADVLPNTGSPSETTTGSGVATESSINVNATEAASVITNVSNSPDATTIVADVPTNSNIAASSVSETTKVEIAQTISPDVSANDVTVTPEIVTVDDTVTPGYIDVETVATTPEVVTEAQTEQEGGSTIFFLPNEPGASVIEITSQ